MNLLNLINGDVEEQEFLNYHNINVTYTKLPRGIYGFVFQYFGIYNIFINENISSFKKKNTLLHYMNDVDDVLDAVEIAVDRKFAISEDGINGTIVSKKGYVYAKVGETKLQYKATKPDFGTDQAVLIAEIEEVVPATQGMFIGLNGKNLAMQYNIVRCRVIA